MPQAETPVFASGANLTLDLGAGDAERRTVTYDCDGRDPLAVTYLNAAPNFLALITLDDGELVFTSVLSGSGVRYASGRFIWWTRGAEASLYDLTLGEDAEPVASCLENSETAVRLSPRRPTRQAHPVRTPRHLSMLETMPKTLHAVKYLSPADAGLIWDILVVTSEDRRVRRRRLELVHGDFVLVDFPQTLTLESKGALLLEDGRQVGIEAAEELLYEVRGRDPIHLMQLCWQPGQPTPANPDRH